MKLDWARILLAVAVSLIIVVLLEPFLPSAVGIFLGLISAALVARVSGPIDGALICAAAAFPPGLYFGYQAGVAFTLENSESQLLIQVLSPLVGAFAYAAVGTLTGLILGFGLKLVRRIV